MGEDILADWKKNRFVVADSSLIETNKHLIVLTDIKYWAEHADELAEWCKKNKGVVPAGMTVEIEDAKTLTYFILKWS
jgi:hypothetical protein